PRSGARFAPARATSFVAAPPRLAVQKTKASAPTSSTTWTSAGIPSGASSSDSGRTPTTSSVQPAADAADRTDSGSGTGEPASDTDPFVPSGTVSRFIDGEPMKEP